MVSGGFEKSEREMVSSRRGTMYAIPDHSSNGNTEVRAGRMMLEEESHSSV